MANYEPDWEDRYLSSESNGRLWRRCIFIQTFCGWLMPFMLIASIVRVKFVGRNGQPITREDILWPLFLWLLGMVLSGHQAYRLYRRGVRGWVLGLTYLICASVALAVAIVWNYSAKS